MSTTITPTGAQGWYWKQASLWVHRPGAASDTMLATHAYQPTILHTIGAYGGAGASAR